MLQEDPRDAELLELADALRDLLDSADEPAVAALGDQCSGVGLITANREEAPDAIPGVPLALADEAGRHHGVAERRSIARELLAGPVEGRLAPTQLLVRSTERVDLVRIACRERGEARLDGSAKDERRVRLLHGTREGELSAEGVCGSFVIEALRRPRLDNDLDLLREESEAPLPVEEREAVRDVLPLVPARAHPDVDASARDVVDGHGHPGEHARVAERRGRDQSAEPDSIRERGQPGDRRPGVVRVRVGPDDRGVVVGAEESLEVVALGQARETNPIVPRHALLPFDHETDAHQTTTSSGSVTGALHTKRSQT